MAKLSWKAEQMLAVVREATTRDSEGNLTRFFVPTLRAHYNLWGVPLKDPFRVQGAADAASLKGLEARGLIKKMALADYAYAVTEDGILEYEAIASRKRAAGEIP